MAERLFMAYWNEGKDVGDHEVLAEAAGAVGLNAGNVLADLKTALDTGEVEAEITMASRMGVTGVPTYILAQKYGVVGAQSADILADAIRKVASGSA
jgi:predicted DsbA family dithiol-disulfide isomerase